MKSLTTLSLTLAVLLAATGATAQTRVDFTPSAAYLNSLNDVIDQNGITARYAAAPGFGGRLSIWLNDKVMIEGSGHYGRTTLDGQIYDQTSESIDLAIFYGSAQIGVALGAEGRLLLHGGVGVQGTNFDEAIEGGNIWTGVVGLSGVRPLNDSVALRVDFDVHLHTAYFELGDVVTDELSQIDTVLAVGLQFDSGGP